jgi:aminodeoxychorismate synthase component I
MQLHVESLRGWVSPTNAFIALFAEAKNAFWFDREFSQDNRFSVIGTGDEIDFEDFDSLRQSLSKLDDINLPFSFRPGLVGWLDFELSNPRFIRVESAMVFDHEKRHLYLIAKSTSETKFRHWLDGALLRIGLIGGESLKYLHQAENTAIESVTPRHNDTQYLKLIEKAQEYIAAGDVYQLCLTNQYSIKGFADPLSTFIELRTINPAPYAGYFKFGDTVLVSSSPEQFISVSERGEVSSKPIKGTRPRGRDDEHDLKIVDELRNNTKERAENLMIVDLMRNDLTKVCKPDSVSVPKLFDVETYATVHQLVSTVTGELRDGEDAISALAAAVPGGSMTGAPKLRAVEIIGELEKGNRGVYSGVAGFLGDNSAADFGMVIRSLVFENGTITLGVGGGITIDSESIAELAETKLKALALLKALKASHLLA